MCTPVFDYPSNRRACQSPPSAVDDETAAGRRTNLAASTWGPGTSVAACVHGFVLVPGTSGALYTED